MAQKTPKLRKLGSHEFGTIYVKFRNSRIFCLGYQESRVVCFRFHKCGAFVSGIRSPESRLHWVSRVWIVYQESRIVSILGFVTPETSISGIRSPESFVLCFRTLEALVLDSASLESSVLDFTTLECSILRRLYRASRVLSRMYRIL